MQLGEVIRTYRKSKNMTQEEMAGRLGVTAPAVNKWENGNSFPDIMLLAPIARLLDVSLDTLLSFREELTESEISGIVCEVQRQLKEESYDEAFCWAKKKIEQYPDCEQLIWQLAVVLDAWRLFQNIPDEQTYDKYLCSLYDRALKSADETIRNRAADSLFSLYMRRDQYEKAEECLKYFSEQNPERKRKQAQIFSETDRIQEAYKAYEELLFLGYQTLSGTLNGMYRLAIQEDDMDRAHMLAAKQEEMARCFEMGRYYEVMGRLDIAAFEKDTEAVIKAAREMISGAKEIGSFRSSLLYEHMEFKEISEEYRAELKKNLLQCFRDEENYGFLENDERWKQIVDGIS